MQVEYVVGFRFVNPLSLEAVDAAMSGARDSLEVGGVVVKSWDYDEVEGLLLVRVSSPPHLLSKVQSEVEEGLSAAVGVRVEAVQLSPEGYTTARRVLPSPPIMGFLLRALKAQQPTPLSDSELLTLLASHFVGCDRERVLITAAFLGLDPVEVEGALKRLEERGCLDLKQGKLTREGEKLLDALVPQLRVSRSPGERPLLVVDEEGNVEAFDVDRVVSSLHGSEVPHTLASATVSEVVRALEGRRYISKRALTSCIQSALEELDPSGISAARFHNYVYALNLAYVRVSEELRRSSWRLLREVARGVLLERGLRPPPRCVRLLAEHLADEVRSHVATVPRGLEHWVLEEEELASLARLLAPRVSAAWAHLARVSALELAKVYWSKGSTYIRAALESDDCSEGKDLAMNGLLLVSSSILLSRGILPSNSLGVNLGALRTTRVGSPPDERRSISRFCKLASRLMSSPAVASPSELRAAKRLIGELAELLNALPQS